MEKISKEKFREYRDQIVAILKQASEDGADAPVLCACALNEMLLGTGFYYRVVSDLQSRSASWERQERIS